MTERSYTIKEIDEIRKRVEFKYLFGKYRLRGSCSSIGRTYTQQELDNHIEQRTRTIMMAGLTADDLID